MPWKKISRPGRFGEVEGLECPLRKFSLDDTRLHVPPPQDVCPDCNFYNPLYDGYINEKCRCPENLTSEDYKKLMKQYQSHTEGRERSRKGFQEFVNRIMGQIN